MRKRNVFQKRFEDEKNLGISVLHLRGSTLNSKDDFQITIKSC